MADTINRSQNAVANRSAADNRSVDNFVDFYELLHVQDTAPAAVIKASYRALMQKLKNHPDVGGDVSFAQQLNHAVEVLCDADARASYDQVRANHLSTNPGSNRAVDSDSLAAGSAPPGWGAPGGSPNGYTQRNTEQNRPTARIGQNATAEYGKSASQGQDSDHYHALNVRNQCPFCQAPYPSAQAASPGAYSVSHRCKTCNGATAEVKPIVSTSTDHLRKIHRQVHETAARIWLEWPSTTTHASRLTDFSPTGCALQIMEPVVVGQCIMIETDLFNAICRVRHCRRPTANTSFIIGVEFVTLDIMALRGSLLNATA